MFVTSQVPVSTVPLSVNRQPSRSASGLRCRCPATTNSALLATGWPLAKTMRSSLPTLPLEPEDRLLPELHSRRGESRRRAIGQIGTPSGQQHIG